MRKMIIILIIGLLLTLSSCTSKDSEEKVEHDGKQLTMLEIVEKDGKTYNIYEPLNYLQSASYRIENLNYISSTQSWILNIECSYDFYLDNMSDDLFEVFYEVYQRRFNVIQASIEEEIFLYTKGEVRKNEIRFENERSVKFSVAVVYMYLPFRIDEYGKGIRTKSYYTLIPIKTYFLKKWIDHQITDFTGEILLYDQFVEKYKIQER